MAQYAKTKRKSKINIKFGKKLSEAGFSVPSIILVLVLLAGLGAGGYFLTKNSKPTEVVTSQTAKKPDPYAGWLSYSNKTYGVTVKYPSSWTVQEVPIADADPLGPDPQEFSANFKFKTNEKYSETAAFSVHKNSLTEVRDYYDRYYSQGTNQITEKKVTVDGKQGYSFTVVDSTKAITKVYLFAVGDKTYSLETTNEELNSQRSSSYTADFNKVYESFSIL
jgi:hypothetical protein